MWYTVNREIRRLHAAGKKGDRDGNKKEPENNKVCAHR